MRLTRQVKDIIFHNAMTKAGLAGDKDKEALDKINNDIHEAKVLLRNYFIGKDLKLLEGVPAKYLKSSSYKRFVIDGSPYSEWFEGDSLAGIPESDTVPIVAKTSKAAKAYLKTQKALDDRKAARSKLAAELNAILDSVTTTKRLIEIWPEVESMVPIQAKPTALIPTETINSINKALGKAA